MAKYADTRGVGRSRIVPHIPGEDWKDRHDRRKASASEARREVQRWCEAHGVYLEVTNEDHHWKFVFRAWHASKAWAQWWPSSAKLVFKQTYSQGLHVHDYQQLLIQLEKRFEKDAEKNRDLFTGLEGP